MELLVVMAISAILLAITLIAVNPARNFNAAADTRRKADLSQMRLSLMQYYVDHKVFPDNTQWDTISCISPVPTPYSPYMAALPCDPSTKLKYVYQALNNNCQSCQSNSETCSGFRILTTLANTDDKAIISSGCDGPDGCGVTGPNGVMTNFGVSSGCTVVTTPVPVTPTQIASNTPSPTITGVLSPTPTITPTPTGPTLTPTQTLTPTPTIAVTPIPGFSADPSFDQTRIADVLAISLALEKYKFINGQYPTCGGGWHEASCLTASLSVYLYLSAVPADPQGGDPYIYIATASGGGGFDGFCLGTHLGDATAHVSDINCPVTQPLVIYQYRIKERGEITYRPTPSELTEPEKDTRDAQRISDISFFLSKMEQYKTDNGHYPNCWPSELTWASTGSGSFFCGGELIAYGTNFNYDPGAVYSYNIVQWDPDVNGFFQQYCFASYMDKGNNQNCNLGCPVNNYSADYCYFVKNP